MKALIGCLGVTPGEFSFYCILGFLILMVALMVASTTFRLKVDAQYEAGQKDGFVKGKAAGERIGKAQGEVRGARNAQIKHQRIFAEYKADAEKRLEAISRTLNQVIKELESSASKLQRLEADRNVNLVDVVDIDETCRILGISAKSLYHWRCKGKHLRYYTLGKMILYKRADLDAFMDEATAPQEATAA